MYELSVKNKAGEILTLSNNPNYTVFNVSGLTPSQALINMSGNATQDGAVINSARVESRNIVIYIALEGDIETNRINLYKYFTPKKDITLYFKNGTRDVYIEGVVELIECDLFSSKQVAQVSIICTNPPYFRAIEDLTTSFSDISSLFEFPMNIPEIGVEISAITTNIRKSILYTGDVECGVIIQLFANGTVVNPTLYNVYTGEHFTLNFTLQESDTIIINTNIGQKSVKLLRAGVYSNALGYMSPDSDWFTLQAGDNVFTYECESGSSNLQITFTTSLLYGGV